MNGRTVAEYRKKRASAGTECRNGRRDEHKGFLGGFFDPRLALGYKNGDAHRVRMPPFRVRGRVPVQFHANDIRFDKIRAVKLFFRSKRFFCYFGNHAPGYSFFFWKYLFGVNGLGTGPRSSYHRVRLLDRAWLRVPRRERFFRAFGNRSDNACKRRVRRAYFDRKNTSMRGDDVRRLDATLAGVI